MRNSNCRYMINAIGKSGETYFTHCHTKKEVKSWIDNNRDKINTDDIRIVDRRKKPLLDRFWLRG